MLLKSIFYKLSFVLILLVSWVIYDRWDNITGAYHTATHTVAQGVDKLGLIPDEKITKTTVYKWTDEQGNVHFSNAAPANAAVESKTFNSNQNLMNAVEAPPAKTANAEPAAPAGPLGNMATAIHDARNASADMKNRNEQLERNLKAATTR